MMYRRYLVAGLLIWLPIWVTLLVLKFMVDLFDKLLAFLPKSYQPENLLGFHIPGLGIVFALIIISVTGILIIHFIGNRLEIAWDKIVSRIPLVRTIHHAVRQVAKSMLSTSGASFNKVLLVQYPRNDVWSIAFQTSDSFSIGKEATHDDLVTVFLPTTPNPTSGFLLLVPKKDIVPIDISVDEALKMVISLGVVTPGATDEPGAV